MLDNKGVILVLGGTRDAINITNKISNNKVIYSLAGVTKNPVLPKNVKINIGGFGGQKGLEEYIIKNNIITIVNATHPYAENMSAIALNVCKKLNINYVRYLREQWYKANNNDWNSFNSLEEIKTAISNISGDILLAIGSKEAKTFFDCNCNLIVRSFEDIIIPNGKCVIGNINNDFTDEDKFFSKYNFKAIVCKNSGGNIGFNKIRTAQEKGIPIYILERLNKTDYLNTFNSIEDIVGFLNNS